MEPSPLTSLSTTVLDFTDTLAPLLFGLLGLVGCSAAAIISSAVRHRWAQQTDIASHTIPTPARQQEAP